MKFFKTVSTALAKAAKFAAVGFTAISIAAIAAPEVKAQNASDLDLSGVNNSTSNSIGNENVQYTSPNSIQRNDINVVNGPDFAIQTPVWSCSGRSNTRFEVGAGADHLNSDFGGIGSNATNYRVEARMVWNLGGSRGIEKACAETAQAMQETTRWQVARKSTEICLFYTQNGVDVRRVNASVQNSSTHSQQEKDTWQSIATQCNAMGIVFNGNTAPAPVNRTAPSNMQLPVQQNRQP